MDYNSEQEKTAQEMEREELNLLIQRGMKFDVSIKTYKRAAGLRGFLGKKEISEETFTYEVHQPTIDTLNRISAVALDMVINDDELRDGSQEVITRARKIVTENTGRMAYVVAMAVLGEDYYITEISGSGIIKRRKNDRELKRLADLFLHTVTPSKLAVITSAVTSISNLADFIASMRFLSGARTTQPRKESIE
jgi:hypothetical protein